MKDETPHYEDNVNQRFLKLKKKKQTGVMTHSRNFFLWYDVNKNIEGIVTDVVSAVSYKQLIHLLNYLLT